MTAKPKETKVKEVPLQEANENPENTKPVAEVQNVPTAQAQVAPEAKIDPVQPEPPSAGKQAAAQHMSSPDEPVSGKENRPDLHTISKADLEAHPELKESLKEGDQIGYGTQKVWKYATADRSQVVQEEWPRDITGGKL